MVFDALTAGSNRLWSVAGNAAQVVFDGDALRQKQKAAEAALEAADASYRGTVLTAFQNVADALRAIQYDAVALAAATKAERSARDYLDISRQKLQLGAANSLDLAECPASLSAGAHRAHPGAGSPPQRYDCALRRAGWRMVGWRLKFAASVRLGLERGDLEMPFGLKIIETALQNHPPTKIREEPGKLKTAFCAMGRREGIQSVGRFASVMR